eukprot:CAMPEP_0197446878 /NCGR_PEP_ID=MMETSP1175-20131217/11697_1 /TAXON_ID=1003142 /ORGANISM="Triceratium dubium, Strain CCMP147" /LENGTH=542 /DNA_ID=CAMNT_0042978047 /DNA_START=56 /DNA_END=1684 /DNA_ORIENTATION=+
MPPQRENYMTMERNGDLDAIGNRGGIDVDDDSMYMEQETSERRRSSILEHIESLNEAPKTTVSDDHPAVRRQSFIRFFASSRGAPQVVFLCMLLALALGSTLGVVPAVVTDRYARLNHGYDGKDCASFVSSDKPLECLDGSADAQNAAAAASFVSNGLTFISSSLVGSISDERGRRGIMTIGIFLSLLGPTCLVLLQVIPTMSPTWYYVAHTSTGVINWVTIALSALSDVMPKKWRAPCFGLLLSGFSMGFALAPSLALALSHKGVSILSMSLVLFGFIFALCCFPETLPREISQKAVQTRADGTENETSADCISRNMLRPLKELSILNRNRLFRILSLLAFFSGMSSSGDQSLLLYYCQERLAFNDKDVAIMFMIFGSLGIFVQGILLKPMNECLGERLVIIVAFFFGAVNNFLYGIATTKSTIFVAVAVGTITGVSFPTISAIKSNNVEEHEQGRIQGALYSLSSLASAVGPVSLRVVYHFTKDNPFPGPGTMFIFGGLLYLLGSFIACALPKEQTNSSKSRPNLPHEDELEDSATSLII